MKVTINKLRNIADQIQYGGYTWTKGTKGLFESERTSEEVKVLEGQYGKDAFSYDKPKPVVKKKAPVKKVVKK